MRALLRSLVILAVLTAPTLARAEPVDHTREFWRFELGLRGSYVPDAGLDPFSTNDYFPQVSLTASRTIFARGRFSFAPGLSWDYGGRSARARGDMASLDVHRLTLPLEGRAHFGVWGYAFVRGAPGLLVQSARIDDPSAPAPLVKSRALFAADISAGYAWLAWPHDDGEARHAHLWLQGDFGYGWAATERLTLTPDLPDDDPRRTGGIDLGNLKMRGVFFRIAGAVSF
jgi:hypothetical protein